VAKQLNVLKSKHYFNLISLSFITAIFDSFTVSLIYPLIEFVLKSGNKEVLLQTSQYWSYLFSAADYVGLELTSGLLMGVVYLCFLVRTAFVYFRDVYNGEIYQILNKGMQDLSYQSFMESDYSHLKKHSAGAVANTVIMEAMRASTAFKQSISMISDLLIFGMYFGMAIYTVPQATLASIVIGAILLKIGKRPITETRTLSRDVAATNEQLMKYVVDQFRGVKSIKVSGIVDDSKKNFASETLKLFAKGYKLLK
jgi:ABC-type multidrug transport system fused ATPase/permease subunit